MKEREQFMPTSSIGEIRNGMEKLSLALKKGEMDLGPLVQSANWANLDKLKLQSNEAIVVALELCPLYDVSTTLSRSRLISEVEGEETIVSSRVGKKWLATKLTLDTLRNVFGHHGQNLAVNATFADIGVFVDSNESQNPKVVDAHGQLYKDKLSDFCQQRKIALKFQNLSDIPPKNAKILVGNFITGSGTIKKNNDTPLSLPELLQILHIPEEDAFTGKKYREALQFMFTILCSKDVAIFRGLVHTYINYETTRGADMHLGMERAASLLKLHTLLKASAIANMPSLDIVVR